ncbi:glycosyl hydrolase [Pedobacter cryophilus]|uniref:T9SS type A sorting domain-containing protein n=1 Tax=Pedobacter cryophilus TaxID=2571271 RepID=A0A4U1C0M7_9SPHI|nr:glycosyl hydrolase [Pedobacter cryophilus]TKB99072.1 T9SS type A sorting domain-containing protein [Pedobacter cryophilus]
MIKKLTVAIVFLIICNFAKAQLTIYQNISQGGSSQICAASGLYIGANIPGDLNNKIRSIKLNMGYMATLAENEDGTGKSFNYIAVTSNVMVDLVAVLQNRVSFIRVMPISNITKKGMGAKDNSVIANVNPAWFYDWGALDVSTTNTEFVPMAWNINLANNFLNLNTYPTRTDVNTLLAFNEPDGTSQANIPDVNVALPVYKNLLRTGYRMGSPATKEENWNNWLSDFTTIASADDARIDFVAIHWYDWGNWSSSTNANPDPEQVLTRFKNYINAVYALYKKPIWITEFNANVNRPSAVQDAFMRLALPYLESDNRIERYAYFFETNFPAAVNGTLTTVGQTYKDHVSTASLTANVVDTRSTNIVSSTDNLVFNGDFEDATSYTNGWTLSTADFAKETTNNITNSTVRFTNVNGNSNIRSNAITVVPGKTYQLQFTARIQSAVGPSGSTGPTRGGVFSAEILNGSNSAATTFTPLTTTSSTNTILFATYTVPAAQTSIRLRFTKTADIAYLDDVSLVEVSTLPINILTFAGNAVNDGVKINWQTSSEVNNEKFILYRSSNGKDFSPIATINGSGNSSKIISYNYLDRFPANGVNYYQLSQTDFDGKSENFSPIVVHFKLEDLADHLKIYSDSKATQIGLDWSNEETVTASVFDLSGKKIFTDKVNLQNGKNLVNLDTASKLESNQIYILTISGGERNIAAKFLVKKKEISTP